MLAKVKAAHAEAATASQTLLSWQATPLTEAALGVRSLVVAQMLAPKPCSDAPGATLCHACTAASQASAHDCPLMGDWDDCASPRSHPRCLALADPSARDDTLPHPGRMLCILCRTRRRRTRVRSMSAMSWWRPSSGAMSGPSIQLCQLA